MEPTQSEMTFGRQPKPVTITITGDDDIDVAYWLKRFVQVAKSGGNDARKFNGFCFRIYPRAVND